jgi:2'-5' RNA ligase
LRTFVAIHLPHELRETLQSTGAQLGDGPGGRAARWVSAYNMHLTLKFLGDVDDSRLAEIQQAVAQACAGRPPFRVAVAGLGCFPNMVRPKVVWAGIKRGTRELEALAGAIDLALGRLGYPREPRPFSAHITLARAEKRATSVELALLGNAIARQHPGEFGLMTVNAVSVVKSELRATGPVYTDISTAILAPQPLPES